MPMIAMLLVKFSPLIIKLGFGCINLFEKDESKRAQTKLEFLKMLQSQIDTASKLVSIVDEVDDQVKSFDDKTPPNPNPGPNNGETTIKRS